MTRWQATHFAAQLVKRGLPSTVELASAPRPAGEACGAGQGGEYLVRYVDRQEQPQTLRHVGEATEALWLDERQQRRAGQGVFKEGEQGAS